MWNPAFDQGTGKGAVVSLQLRLSIWVCSAVDYCPQWKAHLHTVLPSI